jgi:oligosaccharide translocation protein RFT1
MLLQPVEENARLLFGRLGNEVVTSAGAATATENVSEEEEPEHAACFPTHNNELETLERTYTTLIKMVLYFGLLFASLGSNYTSILLRILAGNSWGSNEDATAALSAFCIYTALLALNGTTEAFVYGVASTYRDVGMLSTVHAMVTITAFGFVAPMLVGRYGTVGLVGANCLAMTLRSTYSISFAAAYFCSWNVAGEENNNAKVERKFPAAAVQVFIKMVSLLRKMLPRGIVLLLFIATYRITDRTRAHLLAFEKHATVGNDGQAIRITSKSWLVSAGKHVGVGIICATAIALVAYKLEDEARRDARTMMMSTRKTTMTRSRPRKVD